MNESKLKKAIRSCKKSFIYVGVFSCFVNLLMLTIPLYMLQVFDRVLASQSYDTLIFLTIIAIFALLIMSFLDAARQKILLKVSHWLDNSLSPFAFAHSTEVCLFDGRYTRQSLRDISQIREFLCGMDVLSLFDAPWTIIYLVVIYMLHPLLGMIATGGVVILLVVSFLNEYATRGIVSDANKENMSTQVLVDSTYANAESIKAMGMLDCVVRKWFQQNQKVLDRQGAASSRSTIFVSAAKFFRMALQISILGTGAYLVVYSGKVGDVFTAGGMIAASILTSRAMAPVERVIGTWKRFLNVRQSYARINEFLIDKSPYATSPFLTDPRGLLKIENLYYRPEGADQPIIKGVNMQINPGDTVAIIGPSGAGKSTLVRLMLGVWSASHGHVSLDGCDVGNCDRSQFGPHVGYCPQEVRLFSGSVRDNISRLQEADDGAVVSAAKYAGSHEMILGLPSGYNTEVTHFGLSGGQQQRIALARAFFGAPCFVVLDEPNSNLDEEGSQALMRALRTSKERGMTIVIVTHQPAFLQVVDKIAVIGEGTLKAYGPRDKILEHLQQLQAKQQAVATQQQSSQQTTEE